MMIYGLNAGNLYLTDGKTKVPCVIRSKYCNINMGGELTTTLEVEIQGDAIAYQDRSEGGSHSFDIQKVIFNYPATIVLWTDGTKTVVKCNDNDEYSPEHGLAMCFAKKALGNKGSYNNVFRKWLEDGEASEAKPGSFAKATEALGRLRDMVNLLHNPLFDQVHP